MGYGFKHGAGGSTGKALGTLVVTAPVGVTATVSKDGKVYTKVVSEDGTAVFNGLTTGRWDVSIDNGSQISTQYVMVTLDYEITMAFFSATISVSYPVGATCTCSYGDITFTATDMSGNYTFTVPSAGDWTVEITDGVSTVNSVVNITSDGQVENVRLAFFTATISVTYPEGSTCICSDGTTTLTAPDTSGSCTFTVRNIGSWTVSITNGSETADDIVEITSDGQNESLTLDYGTYLFNSGNQYEDVTGGWTSFTHQVASGYAGTTATIECVDNLVSTLTLTRDYQSTFVSTTNAIDFTDYSTVIFEFADISSSRTDGSLVQLMLFNEAGSVVKYGTTVLSSTGEFTANGSVDVSGFNGKYYVGYMMWAQVSGVTITAELTKVQLS